MKVIDIGTTWDQQALSAKRIELIAAEAARLDYDAARLSVAAPGGKQIAVLVLAQEAGDPEHFIIDRDLPARPELFVACPDDEGGFFALHLDGDRGHGLTPASVASLSRIPLNPNN